MWPDPLKKYLAISIIFFFIFSGIPISKCTATDNEVKSDFPAKGFFYVAEKDGVWWFVNSTGQKFFVVGVARVIPNEFYCDNLSDWTNITKKRLDEWGFNSMAGWVTPNDNDFFYNISDWANFFPNMPYTCRFRFKHLVGEPGWVSNARFPDVFNPYWQNTVRNIINETVKFCRNDSNLIGYESDNEMKWGPDTGDTLTLIELYMSAPAGAPGKIELVRFLSERYDNNTDEFNDVWNMNIQNFTDLFNYTSFGIEGWRVQSPLKIFKIKLYRENPLFLKKPQLLKKAEADITDFSRYLAKTYFSFMNTTLKTADHNHLYLGVRFHCLGVPLEVLEECGNYTDVITINYYRTSMLKRDPVNYLLSKAYDCVTFDNWMREYYEKTGRPLLVQEFWSLGNDGSWPKTYGKEAHNSRTQNQRANFYNWYVSSSQKAPYMVGQGFYFLYADELFGNGGLVNVWNEPHDDFVSRITDINLNAIKNHEKATYGKISLDKPFVTDFLSGMLLVSLDLNKKILQSTFNLKTLPFNLDEEYSKYPAETARSSSCNFNVADGIDDLKTYYVGGSGPDNYTKIQEAIENASDGDILFVYNGTYNEKLIINKSISLIGEDRTGTNISGFYVESDRIYKNKVISIQADDVTICGFNITTEGGFIDSSANYRYCAGIYLKKHNNTNISGNIFYKLSKYGIISLKSDYTKITNNVFSNYDINEGCGVIMDGSNNSLINSNIFEENPLYGIWMSWCKDNVIQNNFISNSAFGIIILRSHDNVVFGNTIKGNQEKGICLKESEGNTINSNNFIDNPNHASFFQSYDNIWDDNYWGRFRFLPKLIFGKTGKESLISVVNIDTHPLKKPYVP